MGTITDARHIAVVDLGHGDAGKGSTVDWLCSPAGRSNGPGRGTGSVGAASGSAVRGKRRIHSAGSAPDAPAAPGGGSAAGSRSGPDVRAVIRFNGGAQAGHNVVTPDGRQHTFSQFGAGTFHGVPTHLSRHSLVEPFALAKETAHLYALRVPDPAGLITVDARALLTTPYHRAANRARETARGRAPGGGARHGSCGMGIGETVSYSLSVPEHEVPRVGDCRDRAALERKLVRLRDFLAADLELSGLTLPDDLPTPEFCAEVYAAFAQAYTIVGEEHLPRLLASGPCVFEAAQGVLLDEWYGFHPHTTWSTTTFRNALDLVTEAGGDAADVLRLGVVRTYTTRHGAGPLVTEDAALPAELSEPHNETGAWQGAFRIGHFDAVAHRYALDVCDGADALVVTHADRVPSARLVCRAYQTADGNPVLTTLPRSPAPDLGFQAALTSTVAAARPVLTAGPADAADWPEFLAAELGVPLGLVSRGAAWPAKTVAAGTRLRAR